jgi:hypothetical protein
MGDFLKPISEYTVTLNFDNSSSQDVRSFQALFFLSNAIAESPRSLARVYRDMLKIFNEAVPSLSGQNEWPKSKRVLPDNPIVS